MGRARRAAEMANNDLREREQKLLSKTSVDQIKDLIPKHTDSETAKRLIKVIDEHTCSNLSIAELQEKVGELGEECRKVLSKVLTLI